MSTLKKCLDKYKLGDHERAILNGMVDDAKAEGYPAHQAAVEAVKEFKQQVEDDLADIEVQVTRALEHDYQGTGASAFNRWFGKSQVIDEKGRPRIVYHGSTYPVDFDAFETDPGPANVDEDAPERASGPDPTAFLGSHFSETPGVANQFAQGIYSRRGMPETGRVYPVYLSIERPLKISEKDMLQRMEEMPTTHYSLDEYVEDTPDDVLAAHHGVKDAEDFWDSYDKSPDFRRAVYGELFYFIGDRYDEGGYVQQELAHDVARAWKEQLIDEGYDGIQYENKVEGGTSWIAFYPWQVKSQFNPSPSKDKPQLLASMKKRADGKWLKQLPKEVADQIRRDADLNPKVADLVVALNAAGINTIMSGDLYGNDLVYVDLPQHADAEQMLYLAQDKLPAGWSVTNADIVLTRHDLLGEPIKPELAGYLRNIIENTASTRLAKSGTTVSPEEIDAIVKAIKPHLKKKPGTFSVKLPIFKTTQEAYEFGKQATPQQVELLRAQRNKLLESNAVLGAMEELSDEGLQALMESGYQAQLLREAIEASEGRLDDAITKTAAWVHRSPDKDGRYSIRNVQPWPDGFPRVAIHTTVKTMQRHKDYRAAKVDGDFEAAHRLVRDLVKVDRVKKMAEQYPGATLVPVIEWEADNKDGRINMIPLAYAYRIAEVTGLQVTTDIKSLSMGERTGKDALSRLLGRPAFTGAVAPNQDYILVDDAVTQGGTFAELRHFIDNAGGTVVLSTSLTAQKDSTQLAPREETLAELNEKFGFEEARQVLADFDIAGAVEALTEGEAKYLAKFASAESFAGKADERLRSVGGGIPVEETQTGLIPESHTHLVPASELGTFSVKKPSKKKSKLSAADEKLAQAIAGAIQTQLQFKDVPAHEGSTPPESATELTPFQSVRVQTTGYIAAAGNVARNAEDVASVVAAMRKSAQEFAFMVVTGNDGVILEVHRYSKGTKGASNINTVEMIGRAARIPGASMVYFIHNHPSGQPLPSAPDIHVTERGLVMAEQAGLRYQSLIIAGTSWGTINPVGSYLTGETHPIRPTIRKTLLPIKERYQVKPVKGETLGGPEALIDWLKQNDFVYKTGIVFANAQNQPVGFLRIGPSSGPRAATEILKAAEFTNASAAFINVTDAGDTARTRNFFQSVTALTSGDLHWLDVVVRGVSQGVLSPNQKSAWISPASADLLTTAERLKSARVTTKHMEATFSVRRKDVNRAIERGLMNETDLAIARDMEELTAIDEELELTRTGQPQGNAIAISNRIRTERPYLFDRIREIERRTGTPLLDVHGNLLMHPMEAKTVTNTPGPTASKFYPIGGQRPWLIGALRTLTQTYLDNMSTDEREHFRKAIVKSIELAYAGAVSPERGELNTGIQALSRKQRPDTGFALARPLKRSHKTYAALNINSQCPMLIIGCHGCYLDGCYVIGLAETGRAVNFYRSAMYTGEILQIRDSEIRKLRATGGLRVNGHGDLTWSERFQMEDVVRHAHMRGLPLKVITKQDDTVKIIQWLIKNKVPGAREVLVQPSVDPYWIEIARQDDLPGSAMKALQVIDMIAAGKLEPAAKFVRDEMGRNAKVINGKVYRKYGYSWDQVQQLSKKYPNVRMLPRVVVSSAQEIAEYALKLPEVLQTWMHATMRPGIWSEVDGKDLTETALNFRDPIAIRKVDGEWRILRGVERGTEQVGEGTAYTAVETYIKQNYKKTDQEKIFKTLSGQLAANESSLCCALGASLDACFDCQSSCNHGTYYTGAELRDIASRGATELAAGIKSIGKRDLLASVRRPVWYSGLEDFLQLPGQLPKTTSPENLASLLKGWAKSGKYKAEELEWSGALDWLEQQEGKVSADQLLDWLRINNVRMSEFVLTEDGSIEQATQEKIDEINLQIHELAKKDADNQNAAAEILKDAGRGDAWVFVNQMSAPETFATDKVERAFAVANEIDPNFDWQSLSRYKAMRAELAQTIKALAKDGLESRGPAIYGPQGDYGDSMTLPGGEDYTEVLLQLPPKKDAGADDTELNFISDHWPSRHANILAHVRFDTRHLLDYTTREAKEIGKKIARALKIDDPSSLGSGSLAPALAQKIITETEARQYGHYRGFLRETPIVRNSKYEVLDLGNDAKHPDWRYRVHAAGQPDMIMSHYPTREKAEEAAKGMATKYEKYSALKTLFIQEIQSDWHQRGREKGYVTPEDLAENERLEAEIVAQERLNLEIMREADVVRTIGGHQVSFDWYSPSTIKWHGSASHVKTIFPWSTGEEQKAIREVVQKSKEYKDFLELQSQYYDVKTMPQPERNLLPDAPFKATTSWTLLAIKRMVRWAVDHGYDQIAWTDGETQNERYNLSNRVGRVEYGHNRLIALDENGSIVTQQDGVSEQRLSDYIGTDAAARLLRQTPDANGLRSIEGGDLEVGDRAMKEFYDVILPNVVNRFFGKESWGNPKVRQIEIPVSRSFKKSAYGISPARDFGYADTRHVVVNMDSNIVVYGPGPKQEMQEWVRRKEGLDNPVKAWALPITPQMRLRATQGLPLFSVKVDDFRLRNTKVVDAQGNPLVVYHATDQVFESFSKKKLGENTGAPSAREGFFFTNSPRAASLYPLYDPSLLLSEGGFIAKRPARFVGSDEYNKMTREMERLENESNELSKKAWASPQNEREVLHAKAFELRSAANKIKKERSRLPEVVEYHQKVQAGKDYADKNNVLAVGEKSRKAIAEIIERIKTVSKEKSAFEFAEALRMGTRLTREAVPAELKELYDEALPHLKKIEDAFDWDYKYRYSQQRWSGGDPATGEVWEAAREDVAPNIWMAYLNIQNPFIYDQEEGRRTKNYHDIIVEAKKLGHDGVIIKNTRDPIVMDVYVVFDPRQVVAKYDAFTVDDPAFSVKRKAPFFSQLMDAVADPKLPARGAAKEMLKALENMQRKGKFKAEEFEWTGLRDYLERLPENEKITRDDLVRHLEASSVPVTEILLGIPPIYTPQYSLRREQGRWAVIPEEGATLPNPDTSSGYALTVFVDPGGQDDSQGYFVKIYEGGNQKKLVGSFSTESNAWKWVQENLVDSIDGLNDYDGEVQYQSYRIGEGKNYRELLLQWSPGAFYSSMFYQLSDRMTQLLDSEIGPKAGAYVVPANMLTPSDTSFLQKRLGKRFNDYMRLAEDMQHLHEKNANVKPFRPQHYKSHQDVVCWVRFDERVDDDGKKVLFLNEIQSDWHQQGRQKGYGTAVDDVSYKISQVPNVPKFWQVDFYNADGVHLGMRGGFLSHSSAEQNAKDYKSSYVKELVPYGPYQGTWPLLALKRMALWAAENGFDRVAWTSGAMQYAEWGSERFAWRLVDYGTVPPGTVVDPETARNLFYKKVPIAFREYSERRMDAPSRARLKQLDVRYRSVGLTPEALAEYEELQFLQATDKINKAKQDDTLRLHQVHDAGDLSSSSPPQGLTGRVLDGEGEFFVGLINNSGELVRTPAWTVEATEQYDGLVFDQIEPGQLDKIIEIQRGTRVSNEADLYKVVKQIMKRKEPSYAPAIYKDYLTRVTRKLFERMQAQPVGEYLPRREAMQAFYDRELVNMAKDFFGKPALGSAEVGRIYVPMDLPDKNATLGDDEETDLDSEGLPPIGEFERAYGFDITDEVKSMTFTRGMPAFSIKRLDPVSRIYLDALRAADPGTTVETEDDISADPYDGLTDEQKAQMKASDGIPVAGRFRKIKDELRELWREMRRHRPFLDPSEYATVADILRTHQDNPENSVRRAGQALVGIIGRLQPKQYEVFSLSLIMDDMVRDIESGLLSEKESLPFGFDRAGAVRYRDYLQTLAQGDAAIAAALQRRNSFQSRIKKALVAAELLHPSVLEDDRYWHHQVLQYHALDKDTSSFAGVGLSADDMRLKKKGWQMRRSGSVLNYNTRYVEAEFEWLSQALSQLETRSVMDRLRELTDITGSLRSLAKQRNLEAFYAPILAQLPDGTTYEAIRGTDLDPLAKYGKAVARGTLALGKMASKGQLRGAPEYQDLIDDLGEWFEDEMQRKKDLEENYKLSMPSDLMEGGRLFKFFSHLMANDLPGAPWGGSIFKAVRERNNQIKTTLGDKFLTPARIIRTDPQFAGYVEWVPAPGKTWYKAWSIPDRLVAQVQAGEAVLDQETSTRITQILARGRDVTWIIPGDVAKTLDGFDVVHDDHRLSKASAQAMAAWKQWTLISPFRIIKYNLNNMSGDVDVAFAYRPQILSHYLPKALADLRKELRGKTLPPELQQELDLAYSLSVLNSGWSVQEVSDVAGQLAFTKHLEALMGVEPSWVAKGWRSMKSFTQARENLLRLAAFRFFRDQLRDGNVLYGASSKEEIDAIDDIDRKAAKLARELLGDYGNITHAGQWLRRHILPFYAWMEVNAPRYVRMMRNVRHEGQGSGAMARATTVLATKAAWKTSKLAAKMMGFYLLVGLWNRSFFPDEEDELGEQQRRQLHLILGRREDGSIVSLRIQGAFSDALSWFGAEDAPKDVADLVQGKVGISDIAKDSALATPLKIINALGPQIKLPAELIMKRSWYPDPLNPRPIRDRLEYVSRTFSLGEVYNWVGTAADWASPGGMPMAKPRRGGSIGGRLISDLMSVALYTADPGEMAYFDTTKAVRDYRQDVLGKDDPDKADALYYYKQALRLGDLKLAERYLRHYMSFPGDTDRGLAQATKRAHPLGALAKQDRQKFIDSLTPDERRRLDIATTWYNRVYKSAEAQDVRRLARQPESSPSEDEETEEPAGTTLREVFNQLK